MLKEIGQIRFRARFPGTAPAAQAVATGARHARGGYPRRRARRSGRPGRPGSSGLPRGPGNARPAPGRSSGTGAARGRPGVAIASSSGPASRRPSTRLIRIRAGHPGRPRSPDATASRKVAERLSDCTRTGKTTAYGVVSLRRHCPDQVPGGRRSASELSPASQPFLPAPGLPGARSVQLPRSPRRRYSRCMGPVTAPRAESPACTGRTSCFSEARGLAGRRRSCFQVWPQGHSLAVAVGGPCREPIVSQTVTLGEEGWVFSGGRWGESTPTAMRTQAPRPFSESGIKQGRWLGPRGTAERKVPERSGRCGQYRCSDRSTWAGPLPGSLPPGISRMNNSALIQLVTCRNSR